MVQQPRMYEQEQGHITAPPTGRPVVYSNQGVISTGHYLTSMAGMRMMLSGGNAFDAAVAAGFAAAVIEPIASYSLATEGVFMLYHAASGELLSLSGQGVAPAMATADFYKSRGLERIPTGPGSRAHFSFTVPGVVDALLSLLEKYGTKPIGEVLAPAIHYAEQGIPNYEYMLERLNWPTAKEQFDHYPPGGWDIFYQDREVPSPGSPLIQSALASTLKAMASSSNDGISNRAEGIQAARHAFYVGPIAKTIVDCAQRSGGILCLEDLASYKSKYQRPVSTTFRGFEVFGHSTWTQGPMLMQALNILDHFDLRGLGHNTPAYIHTITEALKLTFADREAFYGDPDFALVPIDGLLSKDYAVERALLIDPNKAQPELPPSGDPWRYSQQSGQHKPAVPVTAVGGADGAASSSSDDGTTHVAALDKDGNMVCGTISGGTFAKSVFFPELGCTLSTRIEMFNCEEGHPNVVEPGKRPRTTLVNYILSKDGQPLMTIGCPGGDNQVQADVQLILNVLVFGMNPQQAAEAPRFATQSVPNSFYPHVYFPGRLDLEEGIPEGTAQALRALGHKIERVDNCGMGATVGQRDPDTGALSTGGDPRRASYALGW